MSHACLQYSLLLRSRSPHNAQHSTSIFCAVFIYIARVYIFRAVFMCGIYIYRAVFGASVSEPHLGSSTRPLSVCLSVCLYIILYISYVRHFWSRGPRATRKRKPAHLKFKGHMHACCIIYVANASRAITTLIERLHMYSSSLITSNAG